MWTLFRTYRFEARLAALSLVALLSLVTGVDATADPMQLVDGLVSLELPSPSWSLDQEGASTPDIALIKLTEGSARGNISLQPVPGVPFEQLVPAVEGAMAAKYQEFEKLSADTVTVEDRPVFRIECSFKDDQGAWKALGLFTKTSDEQLFSLTFRAHPDDMPDLQAQLDRLVASLEVDGHHLVSSTTK